jgi:O-antigen ligase
MSKLAKIIEYLFYLFVFLLPWQTRWIWHYGQINGDVSQYLVFSLYGTEILLFIILILALVFNIRNKDEELRILNFKNLNFYILIMSFFIVAFLTIAWATDPQVVFYYIIKFFQGFAILILITNFKFDYHKIALAFVGAGFVQALLAIYQFMTQSVWENKWLGMAAQISSTGGASVVESESLRWLRAYGSLPHPNVLAGFLIICIVLILILLFLSKNKYEKIFLWFSLPIVLTGLFFCFSKNAYLALAIGLLFIVIFVYTSHDRQSKIILSNFLIILVLFMGVLTVIYQDPLSARLEGETRLEVKSNYERIVYFSQAKELVEQNWYRGVGLGNYTLALFEHLDEKRPAWFYQPVHNVYFLICAELGVVGFVIFALLLIEIFKKIYYFKFPEYSGLMNVFDLFKEKTIYDFYKERMYWFLCFSAIFIMLLVIMVFDHYLWTLYFGIILCWLCLGLLLKQISLIK